MEGGKGDRMGKERLKQSYTREEIADDIRLFCFELNALEESTVPEKFQIRSRILFWRARRLAKRLSRKGYLNEKLRTKFLLIISQINLLMITDETARSDFEGVRDKLIRERFFYLISPEYSAITETALAEVSPEAAEKAISCFSFFGEESSAFA